MKKIVASTLLAVLMGYSGCGPVYAEQVSVVYEQARSKSEQHQLKKLKGSQSLSDVARVINETFRLSQPLRIVFGGEDDPYFDPNKFEIVVPYRFVSEVAERFIAADYTKTGLSIEDATMDVLMHTLFHELGHALIALYELPIVGREEDAADGLATVLLVEFFEDGGDIALSAADLFALESEDIKDFEAEDFWDEHSLDIQRYYTTLCHVYGSDPEQYAALRTDIGFPEHRAELCEEEYDVQVNSWLELLAPYLKEEAEVTAQQ